MTIAERISSLAGDDGQNFPDEFLDALETEAIRKEQSWNRGATKYIFPDGSAIVEKGPDWDFALAPGNDMCFCLADDEHHSRFCPLFDPEKELRRRMIPIKQDGHIAGEIDFFAVKDVGDTFVKTPAEKEGWVVGRYECRLPDGREGYLCALYQPDLRGDDNFDKKGTDEYVEDTRDIKNFEDWVELK